MKLSNPEDFLDIGYMAENFTAYDCLDNEIEVHRSKDESIKIYISMPLLDERTLEEIKIVDSFLNSAQIALSCYLILSQKSDCEFTKDLQKCKVLFDKEDDFCSNYGLLTNGGMMAKALFVIGKEGAIYHIQTPKELHTPFDLENLRIYLNKTYATYNGEGCHG